MARETNAFADEPSGTIERGRGGFYRNALDTPYVTVPSGELVKSGPRKGLPKRTPYGSPSGFGKLIENSKALEKWGERRSVLGLGLTPALWPALLELAKLDVDSDEYKAEADRIIVAAKEAAEANLSADRGTHGHAIVEDDDEGRDWIARAEAGELLGIPVDAQRAMVQAWRDMLAQHGLEILCSESSCIDDAWRLAGTLDNVARCTRSLRFRLSTGEIRIIPAGDVVVLDKKTGQRRTDRAGVIQYWHGYVIQVASYAQSQPYDTEAETRSEWPWPISQEHALIAHLDVLGAINGQPSCELVYVDLVAGRELGGATVLKAKEWNARTDMLSVAQIEASATDTGGPIEVPAPEPIATEGSPVAPGPSVAPPAAGDGAAFPSPAAGPSRLRQAQLDRAAIDTAADAARTPPPSPAPDEGIDLSGDDYASGWAVLQTKFQALDRRALDWTGQLIKEAREAGVGFQQNGGRTARRFEIYRGLIALAAAEPDDEALRALLRLALDSDAPLFPTITAGHALGSLDAGQARRFTELVDAYVTPDQTTFTGQFNDDGQFILTPLAVSAA